MCAIWLPRVLVRKHKPYSKQRRSRLWSKPVNVRTCELHYLLALSICGCVRVSELRICPYLAVSGYSRIASYSRFLSHLTRIVSIRLSPQHKPSLIHFAIKP